MLLPATRHSSSGHFLVNLCVLTWIARIRAALWRVGHRPFHHGGVVDFYRLPISLPPSVPSCWTLDAPPPSLSSHPGSDQTFYNMVLVRNPWLVWPLPCEWNMHRNMYRDHYETIFGPHPCYGKRPAILHLATGVCFCFALLCFVCVLTFLFEFSSVRICEFASLRIRISRDAGVSDWNDEQKLPHHSAIWSSGS
jgi:hypothetical protein